MEMHDEANTVFPCLLDPTKTRTLNHQPLILVQGKKALFVWCCRGFKSQSKSGPEEKHSVSCVKETSE